MIDLPPYLDLQIKPRMNRMQLHYSFISGVNPTKVRLMASAITFPHDVIVNGCLTISSECLPCEVWLHPDGSAAVVEE